MPMAAWAAAEWAGWICKKDGRAQRVQTWWAGEEGWQALPLSTGMTRQMLSPGLGSRGLGPAMSGRGESIRFGHDGFNEGFESSFVG